jgi:hypothetical protein
MQNFYCVCDHRNFDSVRTLAIKKSLVHLKELFDSVRTFAIKKSLVHLKELFDSERTLAIKKSLVHLKELFDSVRTLAIKKSLVHLKELLKLYIKLNYRLFISCLVCKIFRLKKVSCSPSWIFEDMHVTSREGHANFLS